jgi:uncharacterized protein with NRDE domain
MCIAYLALGDPRWPVFIAANRDEYHDRPSAPAAPWPGHAQVVAGLDLQGDGTWLGLGPEGRFALLTNYREPGRHIAQAPSRGALVRDFLLSATSSADYAAAVHAAGARYNGYNLIVGTPDDVFYTSNRDEHSGARALGAGTYVLSNHLLDTPWPKADRLRHALDALSLREMKDELELTFEILRDTTQAGDDALPATGLPIAQERLLSSPFIISPTYGTRCSSVLAIHADGRSVISELSYDPAGHPTERHDWRRPASTP